MWKVYWSTWHKHRTKKFSIFIHLSWAIFFWIGNFDARYFLWCKISGSCIFLGLQHKAGLNPPPSPHLPVTRWLEIYVLPLDQKLVYCRTLYLLWCNFASIYFYTWVERERHCELITQHNVPLARAWTCSATVQQTNHQGQVVQKVDNSGLFCYHLSTG